VTVGTGRGNPGGATFHAVVFATEDGHGLQLVDEPFESVPQGGPDITADRARAHEDCRSSGGWPIGSLTATGALNGKVVLLEAARG
jgi:hypothetical protein